PAVSAASAAISAPESSAATNSGSFSDYDDLVNLTASSGTLLYTPGQNGTWTWSGTGDESHPYPVTITATNSDGLTATSSFNVSFTDVAPAVSASSPSVTFDEGQTATNVGLFSDYNDAVTITASEGDVSQNGAQAGAWTWSQQ